MDKLEFLDIVYITKRKLHPEWRYGQTVFNVMYDLYPDIADKYRATSFDPFYCDEPADRFIDICLGEVEKEL